MLQQYFVMRFITDNNNLWMCDKLWTAFDHFHDKSRILHWKPSAVNWLKHTCGPNLYKNEQTRLNLIQWHKMIYRFLIYSLSTKYGNLNRICLSARLSFEFHKRTDRFCCSWWHNHNRGILKRFIMDTLTPLKCLVHRSHSWKWLLRMWKSPGPETEMSFRFKKNFLRTSVFSFCFCRWWPIKILNS